MRNHERDVAPAVPFLGEDRIDHRACSAARGHDDVRQGEVALEGERPARRGVALAHQALELLAQQRLVAKARGRVVEGAEGEVEPAARELLEQVRGGGLYREAQA